MEIRDQAVARIRFVFLKDTRTTETTEIGCTSIRHCVETRVLISTCSLYVGSGMHYVMTKCVFSMEEY